MKMVRRSDFPSDSREVMIAADSQEFELSCNGTHTVIEFPESVNFFVSKINYKSREIDVYDPNNCLVGQLLKIHKFSNSPFYYVNRKTYNYSFFNCSSTSEDSGYISCLSGPDYQILGVRPYERIYSLPLNCTRMYNTPMPTTTYYDISSYNDKNNLRLNWLEPTCGHCKANRRICLLKGNSTKVQTHCSIPNKVKGKTTFPYYNLILCF